MAKPSVFFLFVETSCRIQRAEPTARHYFGDTFEIASAGSLPSPIKQNTLKVIEELGISTAELRPKHVSELGDKHFDYVVTLCDEGQSCPLPPKHTHLLHAPMPDPVGAVGTPDEVLGVFREVRDKIKDYVFKLFNEIL